jgi:hypothetical protein
MTAADHDAAMRAAFEAWLRRPMMNPANPSRYNGRDVRTAWEAWQAATRRASEKAGTTAAAMSTAVLALAEVVKALDQSPAKMVSTGLLGGLHQFLADAVIAHAVPKEKEAKQND